MDDLLLRYMNASDDPTANEAAAAMAQALRRKQDLGTLGVLSGGTLAAPGAALLGAAGNDGQQLMHAQVARTAAADRSTQRELANLKDLRDFEARQREQKTDNTRAERAIDAQLENAAATRAVAQAHLGLQQQQAASSDAARTRLGASELGSLSELPVAERQVDEAVDAFTRLSMGGLAGKAGKAATDLFGLQGTDAAEYDAKALQAMQAAGKIMEGGKLAAGDEAKYRKMLPQPGDSAQVVEEKRVGLKRLLRDLAGSKATALKQAGYNVPESITPKATAEQRPIVKNPKTKERRYLNPDGSLGEVVP